MTKNVWNAQAWLVSFLEEVSLGKRLRGTRKQETFELQEGVKLLSTGRFFSVRELGADLPFLWNISPEVCQPTHVDRARTAVMLRARNLVENDWLNINELIAALAFFAAASLSAWLRLHTT